MSLALVLAGLVAFLASFVLLRLGLSSMALRYPIAAGIGYVAFLASLRIGVSLARRSFDADANPLDVIDAATSPSRREPEPAPPTGSDPGVCDPPVGASDGFDLPLPDLDDGVLLLVPLLILGAGFIASIYVVYIAPALIAELVLDAIVISSLARRFRHIEPTHWAKGAIRQTGPAFLGIVATVMLLGLLAQYIVPGADSIGDVFRPA